MANVKISGLPAATSVTAGTDVAPLVSGGITTKATPQQIVNAGLLSPGAIGSTAPSTGKFTTIESTIATGTAPIIVASTTNVANLNASSLNGATFATPGAIGSGTASTGAFTTLSASSTVSGTGFSNYLASPPAIGGTVAAAGSFTTLGASGAVTLSPANAAVAISPSGTGTVSISPVGALTVNPTAASTINNCSIGVTTAAAGAFTTLSASSTVSGTGFSNYLASPPSIGGTTPGTGKFSNLEYTGTLTGSTGVMNIGSNQIYKDASGNVALGITTNSWSANFKGFQLGPWTTVSGNNNNGSASFGCNIYYAGAGGGTTTYIGAGAASQYLQNNGTHTFNSAGAGTGGSTITFSQVLYVDGSGNLTISGGTATKASGTAWANPSDTRLKDNQQSYTKGLTELLQIAVKTWEFNGKGGSAKGTKGLGVIADEIEKILPSSVDTYSAKLNDYDEVETDIKRFDASEVIWLLVNSVQELSAKVTALEAK